jgi:hypothetical protein
MKVTPNWITSYFPFLADLLKAGKLTGRKKILLKVEVNQLHVHPPAHDGMVRYTSVGKIGGASFTHFAGSDASIANNPQELLGSACPFEGQYVNPGCYYAVLDLLEYYGLRELTVYLNYDDIAKASHELRNQLTPLAIKPPATLAIASASS